MYSKTAQRLNKLSYQNVLNLFLQLLNNIFEKKSEFKCDRILKRNWIK